MGRSLEDKPAWRRSLLTRFLLLVTPLFLLLAIPGIGYVVNLELRADRNALAARIGSRVAGTASTLARYDSGMDPVLARDFIAPLGADRATLCAEYRKDGNVLAAIPTPSGCEDNENGYEIAVPIGQNESGQLIVRYSDTELIQAVRLQQVLASSVIGIAFLVALFASAVGFRLIVSAPLARLLQSIRHRTQTGEWNPVGKNYRHELGIVISAFDAMMERDLVREKQLRDANTRLEEKQLQLSTLNRTLEQRVNERTEELRIAKENAEAANDAKSRFLWSMSHELRTPLNAIIGFSDIMEQGAFGPIENERYAEYVRDINASGRQLLELINNILTVAKVDAGVETLVETAVDIEALLCECVRLVAPMAEKAGVDLIRPSVSSRTKLVADETKLKRAILNIMNNAVKFTETGGSVSLAVLDDGFGEFKIVITDTGIGMQPEQIPHALKEFGQIDNSLARRYEGTGLGLYIANNLVTLHDGRLQIDSTPGKGTRVAICLPESRRCAEKSVA